MPADAIQLWTIAARIAWVLRVRRHADGFEPIRSTIDNVRHASDRFDVVNDRRLAERAFDRGKGRLYARPVSLALQALDEACFFTTDIGSSSAVNKYVEVEPRFAQNLAAQKPGAVRLVDCPLHGTCGGAVFIAY